MKLGADPELFLLKNDKLVSAVGLVGGSKQEPLQLTPVGHCVQEDNVSVEFNIPPSESCREFIDNINWTLKTIKDNLDSYKFAIGVASASFPEEELQTMAAQTFGCEPDFNAWNNGKPNPRPFTKDANLRSCGGHIHVETTLNKFDVVKAMDFFLGVPSVIMDVDNNRRKLYGRAGSCRPKEYGVEYRTLSNFWIWNDHLKEWVWNQTEKALNFVKNDFYIPEDLGKTIQNTINKGNINEAKYLAKTYQLYK